MHGLKVGLEGSIQPQTKLLNFKHLLKKKKKKKKRIPLGTYGLEKKMAALLPNALLVIANCISGVTGRGADIFHREIFADLPGKGRKG